MGNPNIFFRTEELISLQNQYSHQKEIIDQELDSFLSNVHSKEQLYYAISKLDNSQEYMDSFKKTIYAIETFGKGSISNGRELYVDPFSYSPFSDFNLMHPETTFYVAIVTGVLFFISLLNRWKITKSIGFILLIAIGLNFYNYYIKEPEYLVQKENSLDLEGYKETKMRRTAIDKFVAFYEPQIKYSTAKTYEYDVEGYDEYDNYIEGYVETSGKYGNGYLVDDYGDEIEIDTEWVSNGVLIGTDSDGNEYNLKVAH